MSLSHAIRQEAARHAKAASNTVQLAEVAEIDPLVLRLMGSRHVVYSDQLVLSQAVKQYDAGDGIKVDDVAVVIRKIVGGEANWVVTDVVSDADSPGESARVASLEGRATALEAQAATVDAARGAFAATRSADLTGVTGGNFQVPMNQELFDVDGWFDPATGLYTPQLPGIYALYAHIYLSSVPAANVRFFAGVSKNGALPLFGQVCWTLATNDNRADVGPILFTADGVTDSFRSACNHNSGSAQTVGAASGENRFGGWRLGRATP